MKTITTILLSFCILSATAQDEYEFSTFTAFYIPVMDGTSLTGGQIWDDPDFTIQLPFEFIYFGDTISALFADSEFLGGILRTEIGTDGNVHAFIANAGDLMDVGELTGESESEISWTVTGEAPLRIVKIQWANCGFYDEIVGSQTSANRINFQLWLYETTYDIEYRFGPHTIKDPGICYEGFPGPVVGLVKNLNWFSGDTELILLLDGDITNPSVLVYPQDQPEPFTLSDNPENGRVYRFATGIVNVDDRTALDFQLYPTVFDQMVTVQTNARVQYDIISLTGATVQSGYLQTGVQQIDGSMLSTGVYLMRITSGSQSATQKLIKQ